MSWLHSLGRIALENFILRQAKDKIRQQGLLLYLRSLQAIRKVITGSVLIYSLLQLMIFGFLGLVVVGIMLLPTELSERLWILFCAFGIMFLLPFGFLIFALSEKAWLKHSGAEKMMKAESEQSN